MNAPTKILATITVVLATQYVESKLPQDDPRRPLLQAIQLALLAAIDAS